MGLDVNLYAIANPTDEELDRAEAYFVARDYGFGDAVNGRVLVRENDEWLDFPRVSVNTMTRYYGPGYERGNWPATYGAILLLQAAFPDAVICYGSDSSDYGEVVTSELLDEMWMHLLGPDGDDYRARHR